MKHHIYWCCKQALCQCQQLLTLAFVLAIATLGVVAPVYGVTEYEYPSTPVLVSGVPLGEGAVYRLPHVPDGIDILVKIESIVNSTILGLSGFDSGNRPAFRPTIETHAADAYVDFEISIVRRDNKSQSISIPVSAISRGNEIQYVQFSRISGYTIESDSLLAISSQGPHSLTVDEFSGSAPLQVAGTSRMAVSVQPAGKQDFGYRIGSKSLSVGRTTLLFGPIEFTTPVFTKLTGLAEANDDIVTVDFNRTLWVDAPGLLENDIDSDDMDEGHALAIERFIVSGRSYKAGATAALQQGHLTILPDGSYQFVPVPDFAGSVPDVSYVVDGGADGRAEAVLRISVSKGSLSPVALDDVIVLSPGTGATIKVLENDSDPDGFIDQQSLVLVQGNSGDANPSTESRVVKSLFVDGEGHWKVNQDGTVSFHPSTGSFTEVSPLTYRVADDDGYTSSARIVLQNDGLAAGSIVNIDEDANNDGWINSQELLGLIEISYILPETAAQGELVIISDSRTEQVFEITESIIGAGKIEASFPAPTDGEMYIVDVSYFDVNDQLISTSQDSATVDLLPATAPEIAILADVNNSGFISLAEHVEESAVRIELPASAVVNDRIEVRIGTRVVDVVLSPLDVADGSLSVPVTIPSEGRTLSVLVKIFDEAGNVSDIASDSILVDTVAPLPPSVDLLTTASSMPLVTGVLPIEGDFILSVELNGVIYASGDGNLIENGDGTWQLSVPLLDQLPNGTYEVVAQLTDMAGNSSVDTTANELKVDLVVPVIAALNVGPVSDPAPLISGTTDQDKLTVVRVTTKGNVFICDAMVVENGDWSCRSRELLPPGENRLVASVTDDVGNIGVSELTLTVVESSDQDQDGIPDDIEGAGDADGDGVSNFLDLDSDNDTIADSLETAIDSDGDQTRDFLDLDSDNDSLSDIFEAGFSTLVDKDGDGAVDSSIVLGENGLADVIETLKDSGDTRLPKDTDNDGLYDYIDLDSDSDGLTDGFEQGLYRSSAVDVSSTIADDPTLSPLLGAVDTDTDGIADYLDLDSDQDGVADVLEAYGTDANHDGRLDNSVDLNRNGVADRREILDDMDIDGDGLPNQQDLDSDSDLLFDLIESGGVDINADGIHDSWVDQNGNGISDDVDVAFTGGTDSDSDAIDDLYDGDFREERDSDGDGIIDIKDGDRNGNGMLDLLEDEVQEITDADGDGVADMFEANIDNTIATGTGAFGCTLPGSSRNRVVDPTLWIALVWLLIGSLRRRVR